MKSGQIPPDLERYLSMASRSSRNLIRIKKRFRYLLKGQGSENAHILNHKAKKANHKAVHHLNLGKPAVAVMATAVVRAVNNKLRLVLFKKIERKI